MKVLLGLLGLTLMTACGPAELANLPYAKDCFNGCGKSYQEHKKDFEGEDGQSGSDGQDSQSTHTTSTITKETAIPGPAGPQGPAGESGQDGSDAVIYSTAQVPKNSCVEVMTGIWVENIRSGTILDVYYNDQCSDSRGEYCDNLVPSESRTGKLGAYKGSGTVCWAGSVQISATKLDGGDVLVHLLDFN